MVTFEEQNRKAKALGLTITYDPDLKRYSIYDKKDFVFMSENLREVSLKLGHIRDKVFHVTYEDWKEDLGEFRKQIKPNPVKRFFPEERKRWYQL